MKSNARKTSAVVARVPRREVLASLCFWLAVQVLALASPDLGSVDIEEGMSSVLAHQINWQGLSVVLTDRYDPMSGGEPLMAIVRSGLFLLFGDHTLVHKLPLLVFGGTMIGFGFHTLYLFRGAWTARTFALLCTFPPGLAADLAVRGWLNHYEGCAIAIAGGALAWKSTSVRSAIVAGCLLGLAMFVSPTAAVIGLPILLSVLISRGPRLGTAMLIGASWPVFLWSALALGDYPTITSLARRTSWARNQAPQLAPWDRVDAIFGATSPGAPRHLGWLTVTALAIASLGIVRRRDVVGVAALGSIGLWLGAYAVSPGRLGPTSYPSYLHHRYAVPIAMLAPIVMALGANAWQRQGRRSIAIALVGLATIPGIAHVGSRLRAGVNFTPLLTTSAPTWGWHHKQIVDHRGEPFSFRCRKSDEACLANFQYLLGAVEGWEWMQRETSFELMGSFARKETAWWAGFGGVVGTTLGVDPLLRAGAPKAAIAEAHVHSNTAPTCVQGPEAAWALAQRSRPRWIGHDMATPCGSLETKQAWAAGLGNAMGSRWGATVLPPGASEWDAASLSAFRRAAILGAEQPWNRHFPTDSQ